MSLKNFPKDLINICKKLKANGFEGFIVGGGVRDALLDKKVTNWDLATDATPTQVTKIFKEEGIKVIPTGIKFGTVTLLIKKIPYEITTYRSDQKYVDGRHPEKVKFSKSIDHDLARRDFTINALAYDPLTKRLIDNYNGQKDMKKKIIKTVGNPIKRFSEDGLRPMRACRFSAKLAFKIEDKTLKAISKCLKTAKKVSPERVHDEFLKMLEADKPSIGIENMRKAGLLSLYLPELEKGCGMEQPKPFHVHDVYWHSLYSCDYISKERPILRLVALLHDIAKPECKVDMTFYGHDAKGKKLTEKIMKRLKFSNKDINYAGTLIKNHMFNYTPEWSDAAVRRFISRVGTDNVNDLFALRVADMKAMEREQESEHVGILKKRIKKIFKEEDALHIKDLEIDGKDIMKILKIKPSPEIGDILKLLLDKVIDAPELNDKKKLTEIVKKLK